MKKFFFGIFIFLTASFSGYAQHGKNQISIGPEVDIPMGTFADAYKIGFGGTVKGLLGVGQSGQLTLTLGYLSFKGKSGSVGGYSYANQTFNVMPYLVGYRQNFKTLYVEPLVGMATYTTKVTGFNEHETRLTYGAGAGFNTKSFDLGLRFQSHEGISFVGIRAAYIINLKK